MPEYYAHPTAVIDPGCSIGAETRIWHFSHIMPGAVIGKRCNLGQNVFISSGVKVGDGVKIQNNVSLYTGVEVEDDVFLGPSMVFTNVINPRAFIERKDEFRPTLIRKGASIGANATIVCGNQVGSYALIGAGAVVTRNVLNYELVTGCPARHAGWVCVCGQKLDLINDAAVCEDCGREYTCRNGELELS